MCALFVLVPDSSATPGPPEPGAGDSAAADDASAGDPAPADAPGSAGDAGSIGDAAPSRPSCPSCGSERTRADDQLTPADADAEFSPLLPHVHWRVCEQCGRPFLWSPDDSGESSAAGLAAELEALAVEAESLGGFA